MTTGPFIRLTLRGCWHLQITLLSPLLFVTFVTVVTTHFTWTLYGHLQLLDFTSTAPFLLHTALCALPCVIISQEADHLDESFYNWPICMHGISTLTWLAPSNWFEIIENDPCPPPSPSLAPPPPPWVTARNHFLLRALGPLSCAPRSLSQTENKLSTIISDIINPIHHGATTPKGAMLQIFSFFEIFLVSVKEIFLVIA